MGSPAIWQGNYVKFLKSLLNLNGVAYVLTGTDDPSVVAQDAPISSIYLRNGTSIGSLYIKQDNGNTTNWLLTAFNPMTSVSDLIIGGVGGAPTRLAANQTTSPLVLTSVSGVTSYQPLPVQGVLSYYFNNIVSDLGGAYKQLLTPQATPATLTTNAVPTGTTLLQTFITDPSNPLRTFIPKGEYSNHLHASRVGGTKNYQLQTEIWEANAVGVDIALIATIGPSHDLSGTTAEYVIGTSGDLYNLVGTTSRIKTKVYAIGASGGSVADINILMAAANDSHTKLPAPVVDSSNYVPYVGALTDVNLGSKNLAVVDEAYAGGWNGSLNVPTKNAVYDKMELVKQSSIGLTIDNGIDAITIGPKGYIKIPYNCTIVNWNIVADVVGDITLDIWKVNNAIPTVSNTITAAAKPTLTSGQIASSSTLTGWTISVAAGDIIAYNVDSVSVVKKVTLSLGVIK